jgi:hypothetical protein
MDTNPTKQRQQFYRDYATQSSAEYPCWATGGVFQHPARRMASNGAIRQRKRIRRTCQLASISPTATETRPEITALTTTNTPPILR